MPKDASKTPFKGPIKINEFGESIGPYPDNEYEEATLDTVAGTHYVCRGWVDTYKVSDTHKVLRCRQCNLRVHVPIDINSLGDLRVHFQRFNGQS